MRRLHFSGMAADVSRLALLTTRVYGYVGERKHLHIAYVRNTLPAIYIPTNLIQVGKVMLGDAAGSRATSVIAQPASCSSHMKAALTFLCSWKLPV